MIPKMIVYTLVLVVTITLVQGLPRTHRFKPVVNLNPEKLNTTEKPIEVRKSTLFPKNSKKYMVTDKPLPRMTAPSSYKYFLAKRPLMLKFEPSSTLMREGKLVPHQSLMKKVKFVVSTPSPSEKNSKTNYWENHRPIHIRNNKTTDDNMVPQKSNEHNDKITPQPQIKNMTTTGSTKAPKNETRENILLIVNEEEFKSKPNAMADEVSDIISFVNKLHETKENITNTRSTTQQPIDKETLIRPASLPSSKVTESSSVNPTHDHTIIRNEENIHRQTPNDDVVEVLYLHPNSYVEQNSSSATDKTTTTLSPVQEDAKTESYSLKANKDGTNGISSPEIVFIPVNLSDLKSHPDLIAEEVRNVVNDITKHVSSVTESITSTTVAITSSFTTPSTTTTSTLSTNAIKTTPITKATVEPEVTTTTKGELFPLSNISSEQSQYPNDDIENVIYHIPKYALNGSNNHVTTKISAYPTVESTNNSSPEILFIPVNLEEMKSHPYLIPNEVKNIIDDINRHPPKMDITTAKTATVVTTTAPATIITSTTTTTPWIEISVSEDQNPNTDVTTEKSGAFHNEEKVITTNSSSDIIFLPVNLADLKSHPNIIEDEIKDVVNLLDDTPKNKKKNETTVTFSPKTEEDIPTTTYIKEVVANTTSRKYEILITSTLKPSSKHMSELEIPAESSEKHISPEIIFIPVNLKDFKSHPNGVIDEIQDIVNNMDQSYSSDEKNLTDKNPTTMLKDKTTESSTNPLPIQHNDKAIKSGSNESMTTENSLAINDIVLESFSTTQADVNSSKLSSNDLTTENSQSSQNLTAEKSPEVVFIPIDLNDLESNPVIADEVRDIVNYMNKLHPHDNLTAAPVLQKNTTQESFSPISTDEVTESISSMPTPEILFTVYTTESSVGKYSQNLEADATTESSVKPASDTNTSPSKDNHVTTESLPREIVFIPIKLEELKTNPDIVADEVNDIVNYMNEKDKNNNKTTERYTTEKDTPAIKTTYEIPADSTTLKTSTITETTENVVTPKYIIIEPIEVTALKDDDENDIYVGNIINRPKVTNKQNDSEKTKGGKSNSISDDISDVIYVINKNNDNM